MLEFIILYLGLMAILLTLAVHQLMKRIDCLEKSDNIDNAAQTALDDLDDNGHTNTHALP